MTSFKTHLSISWQIFFALLSLLIVGFGQPTWIWWSGLIASILGYALFWRVLLCYPNRNHRFYLATTWFTLVQFIQLEWFLSHPYAYIYPIYLFFSLAIGIQFGFVGMLITLPQITHWSRLVPIACFWTLCEWFRLFFLSGYTWNPSGLALTGSVYPLQMAGIWGVFGLTFWVILVNLLFLKAWCQHWRLSAVTICALAAAIPYLYGGIHMHQHEQGIANHSAPPFQTVLVQTAFPAEAALHLKGKNQVIMHALKEWGQILQSLKKQQGQKIDLIVMPEYAVRCGTYGCVFPYESVVTLFKEHLSPHSVSHLPALESPLARSLETIAGERIYVNNAYIAQGIANHFHSGLVLGLEDAEDTPAGNREFYSAALYFKPGMLEPMGRYEKRVLVPMGEYIPFEFCKKMVESYGVYGSFTSGKEAKIFQSDKTSFGLSICYEETFGDLMRDNKLQGAGMLVNVTNDSWYPHSNLPYQHLSHARLRTVENGIPLIRASNIGITGAVDSLGRTISILGQESSHPGWTFDSMRLEVPTYTYQTLYSHVGDSLIIGFSIIMMFFLLQGLRKKT